MQPRAWREKKGLTLAEVAAAAGIVGRNPLRSYQRYESGAQQCPAPIVEAIRVLSGGKAGPSDWHRLRMSYLRRAGQKAANGRGNGR